MNNAQGRIRNISLRKIEKLEARVEALENQNKAQEKAILSLYNAMNVILTMGVQDLDGGQEEPYAKEVERGCKL